MDGCENPGMEKSFHDIEKTFHEIPLWPVPWKKVSVVLYGLVSGNWLVVYDAKEHMCFTISGGSKKRGSHLCC